MNSGSSAPFNPINKTMKTTILTLTAAAAFAALTVPAHALLWTGATSGDYNLNTNWTGNVTTSGNETAQFNGAGFTTITGDIVMIGTGGKIATGGVIPYTLGASVGANTITLFNGTGDGILNGVAGTTLTVNDNIILGNGTASTISVTANVAGSVVDMKGDITGGTGGTPGALVFSLGSTSGKNGNYTISGNVTKGGASSIALNHRGNGTVTISGTNTLNNLYNNEVGGVIRVAGGTTTLGVAIGTNWMGGNPTAVLELSGGTLSALDARLGANSNTNSLLVNGGTLSLTGGASSRFSMGGNVNGQTFTMTSGTINATVGGFGVRFGGDNGAASGAGAGISFNAAQSGGNFTVTGGGSANAVFSLGSSTANVTNSYAFSGGTLSINGNAASNGRLEIGADNTFGNSTTTFTLSGTSKLIVKATPGTAGLGIRGAQATAAFAPAQVFSMTGGTLVTGNIEATNLRGSVGGTNGTFVNNGGAIAPGDIGFSGKTAVTGNLTLTTGTLLLDVGGTTASTAWQDAASSNKFDNISVTASLLLGGDLTVSLIDSFSPLNTDTFTVLTSAATSGAFGNVAFGNRVTTLGNEGSFLVSLTANNVILSDFVAIPEPATWLLVGIGLTFLLYRKRSRLPEQ